MQRDVSPFAVWFNGLNAVAAARVAVSLTRMGGGNFSNVEGVGADRLRAGIPDLAAQAAWAAYKRAKAGSGGEKWR
jgi:hypothetical protein